MANKSPEDGEKRPIIEFLDPANKLPDDIIFPILNNSGKFREEPLFLTGSDGRLYLDTLEGRARMAEDELARAQERIITLDPRPINNNSDEFWEKVYWDLEINSGKLREKN